MPCIGKPSYTHEIIISLWLICYIQCEFSIPYLSIPGVAAHDRCNISHIFAFSFQFQCRCFPLIYITIFQEDSNRDNVVGERDRLWGHNHLFSFFFFFSLFLINLDLLWLLLVLLLPLLSLLLLWLFFLYTQSI